MSKDTLISIVDDDTLAFAAEQRHRLYLAASVDHPSRPRQQSMDVRRRAAEGTVDLVRVSPLVDQYPLNHALYYPVYATCEELGLPVSINVGIPGPRVRSRCQDPVLLEDVLIDFPDLVVIGAHMGHPDFRVRGKIFASLGPKEAWGMVKLTPEQQRAFIENAAKIFKPASGAWGRQGYTNVYLPSAKAQIVRAALDFAAKNVANKKQRKTPNVQRRTSNPK